MGHGEHTAKRVESAENQSDRRRIEAVLRDRLGRESDSIEVVPAGLGTRRFYRVRFAAGTPASLIARLEPEVAHTARPAADDAPAWLPEPRLEPLRSFLEAAGLPVPRSFGSEPADSRGPALDLLEDVGDDTLADRAGSAREALYLEAAHLVPRLQALTPPPAGAPAIPAFERAFGRALVRTKAWKVIHWLWPGLLGRAASRSERETIETGFDSIAKLLEAAPQRLAHRDFKAENLHLTTRAPDGREELVMIDVQGAFMAPPEYDLACLLHDLQVNLEEALVESIFEQVRPSLPDGPEAGPSRQRFDAISVVRVAKDVAHVVDAGLRRGDRRRWHEIPRGLELLEASVGRLEHTFPEIRALSSVIHTLTRSGPPADIPE